MKIPQLLLYMVSHVKAQGFALPCQLCGTDGITYHLDDRSAWAQVLHRCPPILSLRLILAQLGPYGWQRGGDHGRRRKDVTDPGSILKYARTSRSGRVSTPTQAPEAPRGNEERRVLAGQPHGQNHHPARGLDSVDPHRGSSPISSRQHRTGERKVHLRSLSEHV